MLIKQIFFFFFIISTLIHGINIDTEVQFSGAGSPSTFFYKEIKYLPENSSLCFGLSSIIPGKKTEELDVDLNLGVRTTVTLLGETTIYFTFDNHDGVTRTGNYDKSDFYTKSLNLQKSWKYPLTDKVDIGISALLGSILLNGEYQILVLPEIYPILYTTIDIF